MSQVSAGGDEILEKKRERKEGIAANESNKEYITKIIDNNNNNNNNNNNMVDGKWENEWLILQDTFS